MSVSPQALNRVLHHLSQVAPVSYRRIFSGVGLYHDEQLFGLMSDHCLYFRVDDISVGPYLERGMPALRPSSAALDHSHFYQLPDAVLEMPAELHYWMRAAVEAAQNPPAEARVAAAGTCNPSPQRLSSAG